MQGKFILTVNGKYSISSAYLDLLDDHMELETAKLIWNSTIVPKQRFIL